MLVRHALFLGALVHFVFHKSFGEVREKKKKRAEVIACRSLYTFIFTSYLNTEITRCLAWSVALMYLAELRHQCYGASTAEVYEDGEDKDKEDHSVQWVAYPK